MFDKLFSKNNWNQETLTSITDMVPMIEQVSIAPRLIRLNIEAIKSKFQEPLIIDAELALLAFEIGANLHAIERFYDLTKLNQDGRFRLMMCIILYGDIKDRKMNEEHDWQLASSNYDRAWNQRFKVFIQLGYNFDRELSGEESPKEVSSLAFVVQLLKQVNEQTHIILSDGGVEER